MLFGESWENRFKHVVESLAIIGRNAHPKQYNLGPGFFCLHDDLIQVGLHQRRLQPSQAVIGSQFEDDDARLVLG